MKVVSYYKYLTDIANVGRTGAGGGNYWQDVIGILLQKMLGDAILVGRPHGRDSRDIATYPVLDDSCDIAYCQVFDIPWPRPSASFVYSIISDYIRLEPELEDWLQRASPDVLFSTQYYKQDLIDLCNKYGCKCIFLPWFNVEKKSYIADKSITAMSTGAVGGNYPLRTNICRYLRSLNRSDILVKTTNTQLKYALSNEEYERSLSHTKYYISGGIYDFQIPPKYFEVCNYGACLVSFDMPMMRKCGFVDGETYIKLNKLEDIEEIIASDRWKEIAPAGQKMVQERHMIEMRVKQILEVYDECLKTP